MEPSIELDKVRDQIRALIAELFDYIESDTITRKELRPTTVLITSLSSVSTNIYDLNGYLELMNRSYRGQLESVKSGRKAAIDFTLKVIIRMQNDLVLNLAMLDKTPPKTPPRVQVYRKRMTALFGRAYRIVTDKAAELKKEY